MKISLEWINEFIDLADKTPEEVAHELTMSGLEVEEIEKTGAKFTNIRVAEILKIDEHPNADKLHLVTLNIGDAIKKVVCGAQNIEVGQIIPYASVGSKVLNRKTGEQFELTPAVIRGVESQGMLCSQDELGLEGMQQEDGILILNRIYKDLKLGENLEKVLNIKEDYVLTIAPTANRGDQMSIIGVARELSSLFNRKLKFSKIEALNDLSNIDFKVEIIDEDTCKYYSIGVLKDVKIKPSPDWMQRRLTACGIRAINNVVDITNYVLLEYGQPLHAFDLDKLDGYLCVRRAKEGEKIITLDEVERTLTNDSVLIADKEKGVCLAGVFGGNNSEIDDNTRNIALESAYFTPHTNRRSARSVGYRSEACARFERGVDIENIKPALFRAIQLLIELADAKVEGVVDTGINKLPDLEITLRFAQIKRILGLTIEPERCISILENLGFELLGKNDAAAKFKCPSFRVNDVTREIDLIEEIARINGYDKIAPRLPQKTIAPEITDETRFLKSINEYFLSKGFYEAVTSSLIGEPLLKEFGFTYNKDEVVSVLHAQSEDFCMLRQSMIPNILNSLKYNFDKGQKNVWLYEIGRTYFKKAEADKTHTGVDEIRNIAGVITGDIQNAKWTGTQKIDFYTIKGIIEQFFEMLNLSNRIKLEYAKDCDYLHPGRSANVLLLGKTPLKVATFGQIHPALKQKQKFLQDVYLFEINLEEILKVLASHIVKYKKLPQFPEVQRDIAFVVDKNITNEQITKVISKSVSKNLFNGLDLFDIYQGENIKENAKSMAYRLYFQDKEQTLTDEVIEVEMGKLKSGLQKSFADISFRE